MMGSEGGLWRSRTVTPSCDCDKDEPKTEEAERKRHHRFCTFHSWYLYYMKRNQGIFVKFFFEALESKNKDEDSATRAPLRHCSDLCIRTDNC